MSLCWLNSALDTQKLKMSAVSSWALRSVRDQRRLTGVGIQLWVDDVDFAVFLCLLRCLCRPGAGHQVVGAPVLLQADQVERDSAELSGAAALQVHHLVVVWDVAAKTKVTVLNWG